jgi:5'-nucleotidase
MRILITNDDGYHAEGILELEKALKEIGDVYVVAPASEMSGASHSLTLSKPLRIRQIDERHWTVDGTPTDCVLLALTQILTNEIRPHICISGINHGPNLGEDVTYSGTVAGALESTILGLPALAFSLLGREKYDFRVAAQVAKTMALKVFEEGLPPATLLNVNVPRGEITGIRVTSQGFKNAKPSVTENFDPRGKPYYWIGEVREGYHADDDSDFHAVAHGFVSVTPICADMTNHKAIEGLKSWNSDISKAING